MPHWTGHCKQCILTISSDRKVAECPRCNAALPDEQWEYDPRTTEELEQHLLDTVYYCPVCRSSHSNGGEDLSGKVCFPHPGKYHCEGVLRKITREEMFPRRENDE